MIYYDENPAALPTLVDRAKLQWDSYWHAKQYAQARRSGALAISIKDFFEMSEPPFQTPFPPHPKHDADLKLFSENILKAPTISDTAGFGDSILAFSGQHLNSLNPYLNFAEPGGAGPNMLTLATELAPLLQASRLHIRYLIEGCYWGNAMLGHQDIEFCKSDVRMSFRGIRQQFPSARRIIYTAPLVYDVYAALNRTELNALLWQLVLEDGNAVLVSLEEGMRGALGLFPKAAMTAEGVHLSNSAFPIFDDRIRRGKSAIPGSLIV